MQVAVVREDPHEHDRARHGDCQAEDDAGGPVPPVRDADQCAEQGRDKTLTKGTGESHPPYGEQFLEMELQADAEHEKNDPDLGELVRQVFVGDEAGRIGPDDESRDEVPHDGGEPETECHIAADEGRSQPAGQCQYQVEFAHSTSIPDRKESRFVG